MRKSVWYHKLWSDKLSKIPIKQSSGEAWKGMEGILDKNLPTASGLTGPTASFVRRILKIVGYLSPVVVIVAVTLFVGSPERKTSPVMNEKIERLILDSIDNPIDIEEKVIKQVVAIDSILFQPKGNKGVNSIDSKSMMIKSDIILDRKVGIASSSIPIKEQNFEVYDNVEEGCISRKDSSRILHDIGMQVSRRSEQSKVIDEKVEKRRPKNIRNWGDFTIVPYSYGIEVGTNLGRQGANLSVGLFSDFVLNDNWLINLGIQVNSKQKIEGEFSHPSFFRPDSLRYSFTVTDERKLFVLDAPLKLEYKVSELVSLNAGVIVNFPISQSSALTQLGPVADIRDTLFRSNEINSALANTSVNRINFGFSSGVNVHFKRFDLRGSYQVLTPYRIYNLLGSFNHKNRYFRVGLAYRFK